MLAGTDLRRVPLLAGLEPDALDALATSATIRVLERSQHLFLRGAPADAFYLVRHGQLRLYRQSSNGNEKVLRVVRARDTFGEGAVLMNETTFPVSAQAIVGSSVVAIPRDPLVRYLRASPDACLVALGHLSRRLHERVVEIDALACHDVRGRVAAWILREANPHGTVTFDTPRNVIASQLGLRPETLSRALREFNDRGLVGVEGDLLIIRDAAALEALTQ